MENQKINLAKWVVGYPSISADKKNLAYLQFSGTTKYFKKFGDKTNPFADFSKLSLYIRSLSNKKTAKFNLPWIEEPNSTDINYFWINSSSVAITINNSHKHSSSLLLYNPKRKKPITYKIGREVPQYGYKMIDKIPGQSKVLYAANSKTPNSETHAYDLFTFDLKTKNQEFITALPSDAQLMGFSSNGKRC